MSSAFLLNASGDLVRQNGRFVRVEDPDPMAVVQRVRTRLRFIRGEWFLDRGAGVPFFERIFGKAGNQGHVRQVLRREILATPGVRTLDELTLAFDGPTRVLRVRFRVNGLPEESLRVR